MTDIKNNTDYNKDYYDKLYNSVDVNRIMRKVNNLDVFLDDATKTDTSWVCMYYNDFAKTIKGKRVLELGCGDCTNAAVMAKLGAKVWANDISNKPEEIINELNTSLNLKDKIVYLKGDFLKLTVEKDFFDIVVGKAFVHHLTHGQEEEFLRKINKVLRPNGQVRFVEPAVNSKWLDTLRWLVPMNDRPSSLQTRKFKAWELKDPHPNRNNSGKHYKKIGMNYFNEIEINSVGMFERFYRLFPKGKAYRKFRRYSLEFEKIIPKSLRYFFARTQTIDYFNPKK